MLTEPLLLATTNPAKAERLCWVFDGLAPAISRLSADAGPGPDETGGSFRENAELKAQYWSERFGCLAVASDGGLIVPALGDRWNALRTARAAGPGADDLTRAHFLIDLAKSLSGDQRRVSWAEGLAIATRGDLLASWEATGTQAWLVERLDPDSLRPGFWAASLCYLPDQGVTLADLPQPLVGDLTWTRLRQFARAFVPLGQADPDRND